ncbi:hypothetical protein ACFLSJ_00110 [Verrucomicrobiota bacterium]
MRLSDTFQRGQAPETGRDTVQLTSGPDFTYPLYYYIPSISRDQACLVYHRATEEDVQMFRLDLASGKSTRLTHAHSSKPDWFPWSPCPPTGVLDYRSVLNVARDELVYFEDNTAHAVGIHSLDDRVLFELPADRIAWGQNCVTPDGRWLAYLHLDRAQLDDLIRQGFFEVRHLMKGTVLAAFHFDSGEHRTLVRFDSPCHHVHPFGEDRFVFCDTKDGGMLLTDLRGGRFTRLRTKDEKNGDACHYVTTKRGLFYEVQNRQDVVLAGHYDPDTHLFTEIPLPSDFGYTHTGLDPEGRLWFYENHHLKTGPHNMVFLEQWSPEAGGTWRELTGDWPTYWWGQKAHFHPQLTPDRKWILFTAGDPRTETNHIFLLDASDLPDTQGIPPPSSRIR